MFKFNELLSKSFSPPHKVYVNNAISKEEAEILINHSESKKFYKYKNPCLSEIEIYKVPGEHILVRYDPFSKCTLYKSERDFYMLLLADVKEKYISDIHPRHRIYYGKSCKKIMFLEIDEKHAEMLTLTGDKISPNGFFNTKHPIVRTVYGDYLYTPNRLFYTKEDLNDYLEIFQIQREHFGKASKSNRCVAGRNIYGKDFVEHIPKMMDDLAKALRAPREWFDFSIEHRDKVQLYLFRNIITDEFADQVYLPLLAYCGEMHRLYYKSGDWVVDYDPVLDCWNPDIRREDGMMARMDRPLHRMLDSTSAMYYPLWVVVAHKPTYKNKIL